MARITFSNPAGAPQPRSPYSQAALVEGDGRRLVLSGQVGVRPDGTPVAAPAEQIDQALANIGALLAAHGMGDLSATYAEQANASLRAGHCSPPPSTAPWVGASAPIWETHRRLALAP